LTIVVFLHNCRCWFIFAWHCVMQKWTSTCLSLCS